MTSVRGVYEVIFFFRCRKKSKKKKKKNKETNKTKGVWRGGERSDCRYNNAKKKILRSNNKKKQKNKKESACFPKQKSLCRNFLPCTLLTISSTHLHCFLVAMCSPPFPPTLLPGCQLPHKKTKTIVDSGVHPRVSTLIQPSFQKNGF